MNNWYIDFAELLITTMTWICFIIGIIIMVIRMHMRKKIKSVIIYLAIDAILLIGTIVFIDSHQHYYKYNDWFILGNDINTVVQKYGDFDLGAVHEGSKGKVGYYIYTDNGPIMPDHLPHYYYIHYDENGIVYQVEEGCAPGG